MVRFKKRRKFNGKVFTLHEEAFTKRKARDIERALRESGWNARIPKSKVVEEKHGKHLTTETRKYAIYKRRRK